MPKVFVSYSHDSPEHRKWVGNLASTLVKNGVDVIIDQWDLGLGDDVPKFMERAITDADYVLMICTERYVKKADEGQGGAGYEAMIVTGEIVENLGTSRFIPIIRQSQNHSERPKCVSTRYYANFNETENFKEEFEKLLRHLHQVPTSPKPKLGKSPFEQETTTPARLLSSKEIRSLDLVQEGAIATYHRALDITRQGDLILWRKLLRQAKGSVQADLPLWRKKYEQSPPKTPKELPDMVVEAITVYAPLFCIALAGVESCRDGFNRQVSILDELLAPRDWNWSGRTVVAEVPAAIAFVYQALHGAMCMYTEQVALATQLAITPTFYHNHNKSVPLYKRREIIGWAESLGADCTASWRFLLDCADRLAWVKEIFGDDFEFLVCSYYMLLNILELADTVASGGEEIIRQQQPIHLDVPVCFESSKEYVKRRAYKHLLNSPEDVKSIWKNLNVTDSQIKELWPDWVGHTVTWHRQVYRLIGSNVPSHEHLVHDLKL